jgi:hypothetical protein
MFKNARSAAVDRGLLQDADAPSYFVECLIYNVADSCFQSTYASTCYSVLDWLHGRDMTQFVCGSHLVWLFGQMGYSSSSSSMRVCGCGANTAARPSGRG